MGRRSGAGFEVALGDADEPEISSPILRAVVCEVQEVERLRSVLPPHSTVRMGEPPELDEPGLVGVHGQAKAPNALLQLVRESLRIVPVLDAHDDVVSTSNDARLAVGRAASLETADPGHGAGNRWPGLAN